MIITYSSIPSSHVQLVSIESHLEDAHGTPDYKVHCARLEEQLRELEAERQDALEKLSHKASAELGTD